MTLNVGVFSFTSAFDHSPHLAPAAATTPISASCPKCGVIHKSGITSCCGRGGSWFKTCGTSDNKNLDHTWKEGIRVCYARESRAVVGQQLRPFQPQNDTSFETSTIMSISGSTPTPKPSLPRQHNGTIINSTQSSSTDVFMATASHASDITPITARGYKAFFCVVAHISMTSIFEFWRTIIVMSGWFHVWYPLVHPCTCQYGFWHE